MADNLNPKDPGDNIEEASLKRQVERLEQEELSFAARLAEALGITPGPTPVGLDEMLAEVKRLKAEEAKRG